MMPLFRKRVEVEEIVLREPVITVLKNRAGVLNVSTLGPREPPPKTPSKTPRLARGAEAEAGPLHALAILAVEHLAVTGGKLIYRDESAPASASSAHAAFTVDAVDAIDFRLDSLRLGGMPRLHLTAVLRPLNLPVTLDGTAGPLEETLDLGRLDLALSMGKVAVKLTGRAVGGNLDLTLNAPKINTADLPVTVPLAKPVEIKDLLAAAEIKRTEARLNVLSLRVFSGQVKARGALTIGTEAPPFTGKMEVKGLQIGPALDALGDVIGAGQVKISGTAGADLAVHGRGFSVPEVTKSLRGMGHLMVKEGRIEGVNILKDAIALLKGAGVATEDAKVTVFSSLKSDFTVKDGRIRVQNLVLDNRDFQASMAGSMGFDQTLTLSAKLSLSEELSRRVTGLSPAVRLGTSGGRLTIPLLVTGTIRAPAVSLDTRALAGTVKKRVRKKVQEELEKAAEDVRQGKTRPQDLKKRGEELLKGLFGK